MSQMDTGIIEYLLFAGILLGPHVLDVFGKDRPVADFMSELGKLLLMFFAGLEVNLRLFRQSQRPLMLRSWRAIHHEERAA